MATTRAKYVAKCNEIYDAKPTYVKGASDTKECDCIGMTKYGLRENGVKFSTTGTNYTFRNQVENIREIHSESDLAVGDVVFKALAPGESGYDLPAKYQPGGSGYNGDLNDYNHIGTVKSVNPLQIIHMTSPTAKMDTTLNKKGWDYCASLKKEYISDDPEPPVPPEPPLPPEPPVEKKAIVYAENGKPVKMRQKPSTSCRMYWEIPCGTVVDLLEYGDDWCKIGTTIVRTYTKGYMMTKFLIIKDEPTPPGEQYTVVVPDLTHEQAEQLCSEYPGAYITVG